jgi:hypothetical protein
MEIGGTPSVQIQIPIFKIHFKILPLDKEDPHRRRFIHPFKNNEDTCKSLRFPQIGQTLIPASRRRNINCMIKDRSNNPPILIVRIFKMARREFTKGWHIPLGNPNPVDLFLKERQTVLPAPLFGADFSEFAPQNRQPPRFRVSN